MAKGGGVGFKYDFEITIKSVALMLPGSVKIYVMVKRGKTSQSAPRCVETGNQRARHHRQAECRSSVQRDVVFKCGTYQES